MNNDNQPQSKIRDRRWAMVILTCPDWGKNPEEKSRAVEILIGDKAKCA